MPGQKRTTEDSAADNAKPAKTARTTKSGSTAGADSSKSSYKKGSAKLPVPSVADFKAKALPLHVNFTHTPPAIEKESEAEGDDEKESDVGKTISNDDGLIGNLTLVPTTFSTGSYGWKGSNKLTVELQGGDKEEDGEREKVQIMISINATVIGSKPSKSQNSKSKKKKDEYDEDDD